MNAQHKWITRVGALLVLMGFFLPSLMVSCSASPGVGQSISLQELADTLNQGLLYAVPFAMVVILIISFFQVSDINLKRNLFYAQIGAAALSLICLVIPVTRLTGQVNQYGAYEISPEYGALVLGGGYVLLMIGLMMNSLAPRQVQAWVPTPLRGTEAVEPPYADPEPEAAYPPPAPEYSPPPPAPAPPAAVRSGAWLEGTDWEYEGEEITLEDQFTIGRAATSHLKLADATVSRTHARIRLAQGAWFIQDQQSQGGVYVNDQLTPAARLNDGDEIRIGRSTFIFHCGRD